MTLEAQGDECSATIVRELGRLVITFEGRAPGSWVKVSCEALEALLNEANGRQRQPKPKPTPPATHPNDHVGRHRIANGFDELKCVCGAPIEPGHLTDTHQIIKAFQSHMVSMSGANYSTAPKSDIRRAERFAEEARRRRTPEYRAWKAAEEAALEQAVAAGDAAIARALASPDDSKYKPARIDPLLTGPARATGATAKAVKRRNTLTKYEYDKASHK